MSSNEGVLEMLSDDGYEGNNEDGEDLDEGEVERLMEMMGRGTQTGAQAQQQQQPSPGRGRGRRRRRRRRKRNGRGAGSRRPREYESVDPSGEQQQQESSGDGHQEEGYDGPRASDYFGADVADLNADPVATEEEAAGMVLPRMGTGALEEVFLRDLWRVIAMMGTKTKKLLRSILVKHHSLTAPKRKRCEAWIKYWTAYMVEYHYGMVGEVKSIPTGPNGEAQKISGTMGIMMELWRIKLIMNHHRLRQLVRWKISDSQFLVKWLFEMPGTPLEDADFYTSTQVMYWKQSHIRIFVQYLTGRLESMPYHADLAMLIEVMQIKVAMFYCQTMPETIMNDAAFRQIDPDFKPDWQREMEDASSLPDAGAARRQAENDDDAPPKRYTLNRDFWYYTVCYFYPLVRRLYFVEQFPRMQTQRIKEPESYLPAGAVQRMRDWIEKRSRSQGVNFAERMDDVCRESFRSPGDLAWLRFRYPDASTSTDSSVRTTRGEDAYRNFHSTKELSREMVLARVSENWSSTIYVINTFDRYMDTYKGVKWRNSYVIRNVDLDSPNAVAKWTTTREPLLMEIFTQFWLVMDQKVWPMDDIYVAICMWMLAVRRTRQQAGENKDCIFGDTYIGDIMDNILEGKGVTEVQPADAEDEEDYQDRLRRGLPLETTRTPI